MCSSRIFPYPPPPPNTEGIRNSRRVGFKAKKLKGKYEAKLGLSVGVRVSEKTPVREGMDIV